MEGSSHKKVTSLTIVAVLAIAIGLIVYFKADVVLKPKKVTTPEEILSAIHATSTKSAISPAKEREIIKALQGSTTITRSAIPPERQREILKALQAK